MKGFVRNNQYLSLCGLNCKLCPMNLAGHCSGCGVDNQSCKIAKCSIEHGKIEYCFQCTSFPCDKYAHIDDFDSFITHHNQMNDMEKASQIGIPAYNAEQEEKRKLLDFLLSHYNDGRRKNLFCVAVNLLTIRAYLKTKYSCTISTKSKWTRDGQTQERTRQAYHSE